MSEQTLAQIGERLRTLIGARPVEILDGPQPSVTVSVGGAIALAEPWPALLQLADEALYRVKQTVGMPSTFCPLSTDRRAARQRRSFSSDERPPITWSRKRSGRLPANSGCRSRRSPNTTSTICCAEHRYPSTPVRRSIVVR